ncbi:Rhamnosyltransferase WbbL [Methylacidimicrobium cyclopophantes]|uniref:Rhamnosyltransferase WbbL n=1 Tax=Methylacidimicrobium cyclopophantes TaxID=1041766 RepID=A0A5E6MF78_9BACT|nr:class I SAM-dependent methyltransferase [Methylacidimicrobium cyclopophantes]VVM07026.1 Rhamnosyltransferase WbbL [Methylacidimicrobium cyclopophantes]
MTSISERTPRERELAEGKALSGNLLLGLLPWFPIAGDRPLFLSGLSSWSGHIPFAFWSIAALRPKVLVELGTMAGDSYLAFCQAVGALSLTTSCFAVDHWRGDPQAGFYGDQLYEELRRFHDPRYGRFSRLLRMDFDEAAQLFPEGSIDLLHIDGCHRYEAVRHDFSHWLPKLSRRAVVLLHDVTEWRIDFGVWRLWKELRTVYPSFLFPHSYGLGVLLVGSEGAEAFRMLVSLSENGITRVRGHFANLGARIAAGTSEETASSTIDSAFSEKEVLRNAALKEPAELFEKISTDPVWNFLGSARLRSRRSSESLARACVVAQELADEGLPNASRLHALAALKALAERLLSSRSFRTLSLLHGAVSLGFLRRQNEEPAGRLRDALRKSFQVLLPVAGAGDALPWRDSLGFSLEGNVAKEAVRDRYRVALDEFLRGSDRLFLPRSEEPELSIVIVLCNQAELTFACLRSIEIHLAVPAEVILIDNASGDRTGELLLRVEGARIFRNSENLHFLRAANQGALAARGNLLLFLNNDAQIQPGTIEAARKALESHASVGAVGARIVNLDGRLQEAGSFFWRDGSPHGYGRGDSPLRRDYLFRRETDYCSGAFLLTRSSIFARMGGFDEAFAPAYYEEADYCLRLWEAGMRVLYEPDAVVLHWEFGSSNLARATQWMERNRKLFAARHESFLRDRAVSGANRLLRAPFPRPTLRLLYIDDRVPKPELGAGYPRANAILRELVAWGAQVSLFPMSGAVEGWEEIYWNVPREVEVLRGMDASLLGFYLEARRGEYDLVWVSRPHNMARLAEIEGAEQLLAGARLVYDAEAVFALREIRCVEFVRGTPLPKGEAERRIDREVALASRADRVVAVSEAEADEFRRRGIKNVRVIGHGLLPAPTSASFESRQDFLLVGGIQDLHSPNADALLWFAEKVLPRIARGLPGLSPRALSVGYGTDSPDLLACLGPGVIGIGPVADLSPHYDRARVFLAPTRFAAGIPMKAHEAASRGVPMVASELIARQLRWEAGEALLKAPVEDPEAFAAACRRLYTDRELWERLRAGALAAVSRDCDPKRFSGAIHELLDELAGKTAGWKNLHPF